MTSTLAIHRFYSEDTAGRAEAQRRTVEGLETRFGRIGIAAVAAALAASRPNDAERRALAPAPKYDERR